MTAVTAVTAILPRMEPHTPEILSVQPTGLHAIHYAWLCSCGAASTRWWRWSAQARLNFERKHNHPGQVEPAHTPTFKANGFGQVEWTCSCEEYQGRASGYASTVAAQQSHGKHVTRALLGWYDLRTKAAARRVERAKEFADRWQRLSPEGRAYSAEISLEELL